MTNADTAPWMHETLQQGLNYLNGGRTQEAAECAQRVIGAKRDLPEAHFLMGLIALATGQHKVALRAFAQVAQLDPQNCAAWAHVAKLFMEHGRTDNANIALANAIKFDDDSANSAQLIGIVLSMLGEHQDALAWYEKTTRLQSDNLGFRANHANALMYLGRLDEAQDMLRATLKIQPAFPNAHWLLSGLKKATDEEHISEMRNLLASGRFRPEDVAYLSYACGKELEDLEKWDDAFDAFATGAAACRTTINFDESAETDIYEALERLYTRDWLDAGPPGHDDASPIFIVGQPRSGTTLVERIITAHSQVHSAGELRQLTNEIQRLTNYKGQTRLSATLVELAADMDYAALGKAYIESTRKLRGATPYFVDKLPSNFLFVPIILKALPKAKIIHLRRDPMDACFSSFKQLFADAYPHSYEQREMARHHARYYHLANTWRARFHDRFHEVAYEDVASDLEPNARALIDYLGIPFEDACLAFHKHNTAVATASAVQVRQPAHTGSIGRWRRYELQLQDMRDELQKHGVPLAHSAAE